MISVGGDRLDFVWTGVDLDVYEEREEGLYEKRREEKRRGGTMRVIAPGEKRRQV